MECSYSCQFCQCRFNKLFQFKKHIITKSHYQKLKEVFPNDEIKNVGVAVPHIIFVDPLERHHIKYSIVGLSAVTLCFSPETVTSFYLCHICEEKCLLGDILKHFSSLDHYSNYINCKHPDAMSFSWIPNMDMREFLSPEFKNKINQKGPEELQLLHLPKNLLEKLKLSTYSEVMLTLSENEKFLQLFQAFKSERLTIQTYQKDSNRKHPLLGMQHLVECICDGPDEKRYYLCTLCSLTVGAHVIIKHVLSFDHIFWYFKMWHPSTLLSKECYREYTPAFESMILDFSKQAEAMHGTAITDMKQVSLEPAEFKSVNFKSYAEALKTLESIKKCSLKAAVKPGKKLVCADKKQLAPAMKPAKMLPYNPRCKVLCQDCRMTLENIAHYVRHLSKASHQKMMWKIFDAEGSETYMKAPFYLNIHSYVMEGLKKKQPVIGTALIVSCITTQVEAEPFYLCFACQECVCQAFLELHLLSRKHVVHTLLFENPWRLPFGWEKLQDDQVLRSEAWEEEKERRPTEIVLKVLDIPFSVYGRITRPTFGDVLNGLEQQHSVLENEVPPCQTYSKLQQNEPFPLLGMQFVVMYDLFDKRPDSPEAGFLCLLCERRLSNDECHDHVFSREHVAKFLDAFHPGSLTTKTDAETLLDLAKQAAKIQRNSHIQVVYLHRPIEEPCSYMRATHILTSVVRKYRKRNLKPQIRPERKLAPRVTVKVEQDVRDDQKNSSTNTVGVKNIKKEMPLPSKDSESQSKVVSQTEKMKSTGDACGAIKQEPEEAKTKEPTGEEKSCHNASKDNGAEAGIDKSTSSKYVPAQLKNYKEKERKRPHSVSETSQEDPCSTGDAGKEMGESCPKRQRLNSREDSCEEASKMTGIKIKEEKMDKAYEAAMDKGLSALLKCCCHPHEPVYLCESCSLKISEKDIVSHLTGFDCHKVHLVDVHVNEDVYNSISKQSFQSAIQAVRAFQTQQDGGCELPSSSASPCMKTAGISIDRRDYTKGSMTVNQVVKKEIDDPGESAVITATSKITQVLPPSNEEDTQSDKVPKPANKSVTCPTIPRRSGETLSLHVSSASGTNTHSKAGITPNTSVKSTKIEGSSNVEDVKMVTTSYTATTTKHTPASSQRPGTSSKASVSTTKPTAESAVVCRTGVALRAAGGSLNNAPPRQTESRVVQEASCKTAPSSKSENVPKPLPHKSKTKASPQIPSVIAAKKPKTRVISENVETSAKTVHVTKSTKPAAAPHQATGTAVRPEYKKPPPEPSQTSTSKTKPSEGLPKVGLNELIVILCEEKQQVYCKLCSVKLTNSSDYHLVSLDHWKKYVKMKFPEWTAKPSEMEKKLNEIATPLAEAEKKLGPRRPQIVKVKKDVYEKLAHLPEDEAVRFVKAISQSNLQVSSASLADAASASPCDVSSSDDGINVQHNESHKTQSDDLIEDELQVEEIAETVSLTNFEQDVKVQAHTEVMPALQSSELPDANSDTDTFAKFPDRDTFDRKPKRRKSEKFQDPQNVPGGTQKATPVQFSCSEPLSVAAAGPSERQNQLKPSQRMEHMPKRYPGPEEHSASRTIFKAPTGRRIRGSGSDSNLSIFLKMKGLDTEPIIGQDCVLECRGIALETFFLCVCCEKMISHRDICQHIVSFEHQLEYVRREYPQFLNKFWEDKDLSFEKKLELLKKVSWMLSEREQARSPEVITLRKEMHEWVRMAPFSEALEKLQNFTNADASKKEEMMQDIKSGHKHGVFVPQQNSQHPDEGPVPKESLPAEMPSAQRLERYQRRDNEARQTQEPQLEKTATVSGLDGFKERLVSPLDVSCSNPKDDFVVSPLAHHFSCCSPQETCSKPPIQPQFTPPVSEYQWPVLSLHVKQEAEHSESPCSSTANPNVSQTLSVPSRDNCLPSRKRPADRSVKTLLRSCTSNPLEDPLPAKSTSNQQQPVNDPTSGSVSQSASVNSAAALIPLSHDDKDTRSISGGEDKSAVDWGLFAHLISRVRGSKSQVADNVETFGSCAASSSQSVETGWDSHCVMAKSELPVNKTRLDSKCQPVKAGLKKTPSSSSLFESVPFPGKHTDTGIESQPVSPSGSSANILCSPDQSSGNPTEVEATSAVSPTATTAEPRDPQHPQSVPNPNLFETMGHFSPSCYADTSHNTGRILLPQADSETDSTGVGQLPISTIVTNRSTQMFMGSYQEQRHTEVNRDHQDSFPTVPTANPAEFLVPSGGYELYGQMPYVASGHPGYPPSEVILNYTTADNPHVYTGTLSPSEAYSTETIYPATHLAVSHSSWQFFGQAALPPGWVSVNMMQYYPSMMRR
ncbi:uncharacterized protein LOC115788621 isoform X3 [Archocentrus centrarchus]|uniref:uncharacterized protein LOC115788621 isoform X3 n=1 Tax=Archocentrus centrarchus TaxID=63155 RepID=UPI0011E9D280|nr:uncharacterized protein LOC115788621 isoform X3 [Archocentrus centrarchus]